MRLMPLLFAVVVFLLLGSACSQDSNPTAETSKPTVEEKPAPPQDTAEQPAPTDEPQPSVPEKSVTAEAIEAAEQTVAKVEEEAKKQIETVKEKAAAASEQVKTVASDTVSAVQQKTAALMDAVTTEKKADMPGQIVYDTSMGKVTFAHDAHAARLACSSCHENDPPQKIAIDKVKAHALCTGCHKASEADAPTGCTGCHKK